MPLKDFKCNKCDFTDEYLIGATVKEGAEPIDCPKCKEGKMEKIWSTGKSIGIDFVGPGFYINDYGKHAWKKRMNDEDLAKVLTPDHNGNYKDPY